MYDLKAVAREKQDFQRMKEKYLELIESMRSPPSARTDGVKYDHNPESRTERLYEQAERLALRLYEQYIGLCHARNELCEVIEQLPDEQQKDVLFWRYVLCMKWEDIAVKMGVGVRHVYGIHGKALAALRELEEKNE